MDSSKQVNELSAWLTRFRDRSWTLDDVGGSKACFYVVLPFILPSFFGMVFINSELALGKVATTLAFEIFFLPLFIGFLWVGAHCLPRVPSIFIWVGRAILALVSAAGLSFAAMGYFALWNALVGSGQEIFLSGKIIKMASYSGRYAGNQSVVTIQYGGRDIELTIPTAAYAALKIGDDYGQKMKLGGLGYYYNWGLAVWK